jgi:hypothetical protein
MKTVAHIDHITWVITDSSTILTKADFSIIVHYVKKWLSFCLWLYYSQQMNRFKRIVIKCTYIKFIIWTIFKCRVQWYYVHYVTIPPIIFRIFFMLQNRGNYFILSFPKLLETIPTSRDYQLCFLSLWIWLF